MSISIRQLRTDDISRMMELVEAAGWNQTPSDWQRFLDHEPHGCFVATPSTSLSEEKVLGSVTTTCYGQTLAWIGMMLVDPNYRRQGIGQALMERALEYLQSCGIAVIKLDATPAGKPLYERLGFREEFTFQRWSGQLHARPSQASAAPAISAEPALSPPGFENFARHFESIRGLDAKAFGADRRRWLARLSAVSRSVWRETGYGMRRPGRVASYLGPVVADSWEQARSILEQLLTGSGPHESSGLTYWDLPQSHAQASDLATSLGFTPVRTLTRMVFGPAAPQAVPGRLGEVELQFALGDPATG